MVFGSDWVPDGFLKQPAWRLRSRSSETAGWSATAIAEAYGAGRLSGDEACWGPGFRKWLPVMQVFTARALDATGQCRFRSVYSPAAVTCPVLLEAGAALKSKRWQPAEVLFREALQVAVTAGGDGIHAQIGLGRVCYGRAELEAALGWFERCLPAKEGCDWAVKVLRVLAQGCRKAGDLPSARVWYDRMLSVSHIWTGFCAVSLNGWPGWVQRREGRQWIETLRTQRGTIYCWTYERDGAVPDDELLNARDYQAMHRLTFGAGSGSR